MSRNRKKVKHLYTVSQKNEKEIKILANKHTAGNQSAVADALFDIAIPLYKKQFDSSISN